MFNNTHNLYVDNHPRQFWKFLKDDIAEKEWEYSYKSIWCSLNRVESFSGSLLSLISNSLGEEQFGNHWSLSPIQRLYYLLKPFIPRLLAVKLRQIYRLKQEDKFLLDWPIEARYVQLQFDTAYDILGHKHLERIPFIGFWPQNSHYAFVLTHDVETAQGLSFVRTLADLESEYGFRSSFNFIPERYEIDQELIVDLQARGFEVGVHGLKHDGKLFASRHLFEQRAQHINRYLHEWGAVGFRAPLTHRNPEWMQALEIEYDASFFDTDPYEPMPGGTMSIWPFFIGRFVELPYTLAQDHTLMVILGEQTPRIWIEKVNFIEQHHGMALLNTHPDYLCQPAHLAIYREFLQQMQARSGYWHALPRDVARWWRARHQAMAIADLPGSSLSYLIRSENGVKCEPKQTGELT